LRNESLLDAIKAVKRDHPMWGYRRTWAYLKFRQNWFVGSCRIYRLMKKHVLLVPKNVRLKAKRTDYRSKPVAIRKNQFWGMDMTKIKFQKGWRYLHIVKDWFTKEVVGYSFSATSTTDDWIEALNKGLNASFKDGIRASDKELSLITDNGCQPTSRKFIEECVVLKINQIFTSFCNPKGNADTERIMRTIKEDLVWSYEWESPLAFEAELDVWIKKYNTDYPHMSLGWMTPAQFADNSPLKTA
jgi:putative transposase